MRGIETMMHEGAESRQIDVLRVENEQLRKRLARMKPPRSLCDLTWEQMRALYAAGAVMLEIHELVDVSVSSRMKRIAGRRWRPSLRGAAAALSRELARHKYLGETGGAL